MASERWQTIGRIYDAALQRSPSERAAFLESACGDDEALRREVERLLAANEKAGDFLSSPAWEVAPGGLVSQAMAVDREMSLLGRDIGHYRVLAPAWRRGHGRSLPRARQHTAS